MTVASQSVVFERATPLGSMTIVPLDLDEHLDLLHAWVTHPRSEFWGMRGADRSAVQQSYAAVLADAHHGAFVGRLGGQPLFLVEVYDPAHSELAPHYPVRAGDAGMHVLVAPPDGEPVAGLTSEVMRTVMAFVLDDPRVDRVVVEPDVRNRAIAAKNAEVGFSVDRLVDLGHKTAALSFATRAEVEAALGRRPVPVVQTGVGGANRSGWCEGEVGHLAPERAAAAHRHLVTKALSEFAHERLVTPRRTADGWVVETADGRVAYTFAARVHALEHWAIDPASVARTVADEPAPLDALELVVELAPVLGIPDHLLGTYLEEVASTLASAMWKLEHQHRPAADLVDASFQVLEAAMTEGHPGFVANNGRIGFGVTDHATWSPEAGQPTRLVWVAARKELCHFSAAHDVDEEAHYREQAGEAVLLAMRERLEALGLSPAAYRLIPVHPWQWDHRLAVTFAADVARHDLVLVGESEDRYQPQQSIRTFFDLDRPDRHYVKTALAIQNMGFLRGLSARYMAATPAINDWVADLVAGDATLRECGFTVLRELAAVGYTGGVYQQLPAGSPYQKMIAALWRESPVPALAADERLMTMAGLLHRDASGRPLVAELVTASGVGGEEWVRQYLRAYLRPVAHCLLAHDLAFMPHGENVILVLRGHVPVRAVMKDIGEEVCVLSERELPAEVERIRAVVPPDVAALSVHTDVFDGVLRHLAVMLDESGTLAGQRFWELVGECLDEHAADHPGLESHVDLRSERFAHSCLNRLQLRNTLQMVDLTDQAGSLIMHGTLANPVARQGDS